MKEEFYFINTEKLIVEFLLCNGMVQVAPWLTDCSKSNRL